MVKEKTFVFFCLCFCHLVGVFADELKSVSVMEGDSVSLNSSLTEIQRGEKILWTFGANMALIAKTDGENNTILDGPDGRFRDRLKLDKKTGSLTIMNIRTNHTGVYEIKISGSRSETKHRFNVTVTVAPTTTSRPTSTSPSGSPSVSPGLGLNSLATALISAAAAGFLLLIVAVVIFLICRKHRKKDQLVEPHEEEVTYADTTFHKRNAPKSSTKQEEDVVYAGVVTRR